MQAETEEIYSGTIEKPDKLTAIKLAINCSKYIHELRNDWDENKKNIIKETVDFIDAVYGQPDKFQVHCICALKKNIVDKYSWTDLVLKSVDQRYIEYYKWNVKHNRGLKFKNYINEPSSSFDINLDFIDGTRLCSTGHGRKPGFGNETNGYKWNVLKSGFNDSWRANIACIHFNTKLAKDNFCKYAYSYTYFNNDKSDCLASKTIAGANFAGTSGEMYFAIPQIDWENISNNPLWKAGNYDEAVLSEMGLKWNADKTVIVKDE